MKTKLFAVSAFTFLCAFNFQLSTAHAQVTAFTYQGRLNVGGAPYSGNAELAFTLWDAATNGTQLAATSPTSTIVNVSNGLFLATVDFGGAFPATNRWLEIDLRTSIGPFTTVWPRQQLTPVPYAMFATTASNLLGSIPASQLSGIIAPTQLPVSVVTNGATGMTLGGTFSGNGVNLTNLNASQLAAGTVPTSVLLGFQSPYFATIGGGSGNTANNTYAVVGGGGNNNASYLATVAGGYNNNASGYYSTVPGGQNNTAAGQNSFAAGQQAHANHQGAFVWADSQNTPFASTNNDSFNVRAQGGVNFVTGSSSLTVNGQALLVNGASGSPGAAIIGGSNNIITVASADAFLAGGLNNTIQSPSVAAFIGGGGNNLILGGSSYSSIGGGYQNSVLLSDYNSDIAGGSFNTILYPAHDAAIGGGFSNSVAGVYSAIAGGQQNGIGAGSGYGFIGGGWSNVIGSSVQFSAIGGGVFNTIQVFAGGAFIGGGQYNTVQSNAAFSVVGGGYDNVIQTNADHAFIGGGFYNTIQPNADYSFLGGGSENSILTNSAYSVLAGGVSNQISGNCSTIAGGYSNSVYANYSAIIGGNNNNVFDATANIDGGSADYAVILGGEHNSASADHSVVGGAGSSAGGKDSIAMGYQCTTGAKSGPAIAMGANATAVDGVAIGFDVHTEAGVALGSDVNNNGYVGTILIGDGYDGNMLYATAANQFSVRAAGGYRFFSNIGMTLGVQLAPNATAWTVLSDRNVKENVETIDARAILDHLVAMPVSQWSYKADPDHRRYIGPMAQDFYAAFKLGNDDKRINTLDTDGVTLAAIQGLNEKLEAEAKAKDAQIEALQQSVAELKQLVQALTDKK